MQKLYDQAYFQRWYRDSGLDDPRQLARKVALAVSTAEYYLQREVRSVLDIGCGEGAWWAPLRKLRPKKKSALTLFQKALAAEAMAFYF